MPVVEGAPSSARPPPAPAAAARDSDLFAPIEAEAVRRGEDQWVLTRISPGRDRSRSSASDPAESRQIPDRARLWHLLESYAAALEAKDVAGLSRIWIMNPAESDQLRRIFEVNGSPRVWIGLKEIRVEGDRALLRFDQRLSFGPPSRMGETPQHRSPGGALGASDDLGRWAVDDLSTDE